MKTKISRKSWKKRILLSLRVRTSLSWISSQVYQTERMSSYLPCLCLLLIRPYRTISIRSKLHQAHRREGVYRRWSRICMSRMPKTRSWRRNSSRAFQIPTWRWFWWMDARLPRLVCRRFNNRGRRIKRRSLRNNLEWYIIYYFRIMVIIEILTFDNYFKWTFTSLYSLLASLPQ